ncbi:MAG: hypothetical protein QM770_00910 [Tepidisphaeraceae bacterium]
MTDWPVMIVSMITVLAAATAWLTGHRYTWALMVGAGTAFVISGLGWIGVALLMQQPGVTAGGVFLWVVANTGAVFFSTIAIMVVVARQR